ncbi:e3 UFM1-protein ligase 1 [Trichonephila clavipes]|uniref:E3 UFM1-protein ligase 1 n=1 Tax=Trichonephila clavipes TaxID=2585209 RepID=A0A8X6RTU8_TRICX|nr:e3 UFM1-protein ligase 1 [Trichonephila clavipes]
MLTKGVRFHHDNAHRTPPIEPQPLVERFGWEMMSHPPYSPDLAPSDFHLFPELKKTLAEPNSRQMKRCKTRLLIFYTDRRQSSITLPVLPSIFTPEDCHEIIGVVTKSIVKQGAVIHVYCDTILVSNDLVETCEKSFEPLMEAKAKEVVTKTPHLFTVQKHAQNTDLKKETLKGKQDKEDKKKKSSGGKSGGGTQGRETKTKNVKKKYFTCKETDDADIEELVGKTSDLELEFLSMDEFENHLRKIKSLKDAPDDLVGPEKKTDENRTDLRVSAARMQRPNVPSL